MYDPGLQWSVLGLLRRWQRLPYSDLLNMLSPTDVLRFRDDLIRDLEWEGLISIRRVGDEEVLALTERGLERLERRQRS
ncbi:MAG: hypothetical protein IT307_13375 [Chloroflexi bacterium]|nr:hypothetical protein [Chloroflexota bacterium]